MNASMFIAKLKMRYPTLNGNETLIIDIENGLKRYSEESIDKLFTLFIENYQYKQIPRWANIYAIARDYKLPKRIQSVFSYYRCERCHSNFDIKARCCPICHKNTDRKIIYGKKPEKFYPAQENCGECQFYGKPDQCYGPVCNQFGTNKSGTLSECRNCICKNCCWEIYAEREALDGRPSIFNDLKFEEKYIK